MSINILVLFPLMFCYVEDIEPLLQTLEKQCPSLRYLSLLGNRACPNELLQSGHDDEDYQRYRYNVVYLQSYIIFIIYGSLYIVEFARSISFSGIQMSIILSFNLLLCVSFCFHTCRYYVLFRLPQLTFLDSRPVTNNERIEAKRVGAFMQVVKPNTESVSGSISDIGRYNEVYVCFS